MKDIFLKNNGTLVNLSTLQECLASSNKESSKSIRIGCVCGKIVYINGRHGLSSDKNIGHLSRHG